MFLDSRDNFLNIKILSERSKKKREQKKNKRSVLVGSEIRLQFTKYTVWLRIERDLNRETVVHFPSYSANQPVVKRFTTDPTENSK